MKTPILIALGSALVTAAALKAAPALAEAPVAPVNVSLVRTVDLDLDSASGKRALDRRLAAAAREVCGTASDADLEGKNAVRLCRDEALARAQGTRDQILANVHARARPILVAAAR
jgi:UrcA family protein